MDSEEFYFQGKFIARAYLGILTRDADYAGFRAWLEVLLDGMSREQIVQFFLDSGEFKAKFGSNLTELAVCRQDVRERIAALGGHGGTQRLGGNFE